MPVLQRIGGIILVVFGLHTLRLLRIRCSTALRAGHATERRVSASCRGGFLGAVLVGAIFAAGWTPCVGVVLSASWRWRPLGDGWLGRVLLIAYSLGLGIVPLPPSRSTARRGVSSA
jgi:cytochrome c-type biogenesis protein